MKLSHNPWPWAIVLTFVLFISGTVGLVVMACSQKVELVSPNYYEQELKFQGQLDRLNRTSRLAVPNVVNYDAAQRRLTITLPPEQARRAVRGRIQLYRPSESGLDRQLELRPDRSGLQAIDASALTPGLWKVRVSWTVDRQDFFVEQKLVLGPKPG